MEKLYKNLELLKNELFDSPEEIKKSFNTIVEYFSAGNHFVVHNLGGPTPDWISVYSKDQLLERFKLTDENLHKGYTWTGNSSMGKISYEILEGPMSKMKAFKVADDLRSKRYKRFDISEEHFDKEMKVALYAAYLTARKDSIYVDWDPLDDNKGFKVGSNPKPGTIVNPFGLNGKIKILEICNFADKSDRLNYWRNYYRDKNSL